MTIRPICKVLMGTAATLALTACGGGGTSTSFIPPPPTTPTPTPSPTPSAAPFGATADVQFPTVGDKVDIRWNNAAQAYEVRVAAALGWGTGDWERLTKADGNYYPPSGAFGVSLNPALPYKYTKLASVFENGWGMPIGQFAFGTPTISGDVPTTGSATYDAKVWGTGTAPYVSAGQLYYVGGTAQLNFNFAAGALSGSMQAELSGPTGSFSAPTYTFTQTVYSSGNTAFSGSFLVPGSSTASQFSGQFTGPGAEELMAQWSAPFVDPTRSGTPTEGTMTGVWIGQRH